MTSGVRFNPPPGWPQPPDGWTPPTGWSPDPAWPDPPDGWVLWVSTDVEPETPSAPTPPEAEPKSAGGVSTEVGADKRLVLLEAENTALRAQLAAAAAGNSGPIALDDEQVLQEVGIYEYCGEHQWHDRSSRFSPGFFYAGLWS